MHQSSCAYQKCWMMSELRRRRNLLSVRPVTTAMNEVLGSFFKFWNLGWNQLISGLIMIYYTMHMVTLVTCVRLLRNWPVFHRPILTFANNELDTLDGHFCILKLQFLQFYSAVSLILY